MGKSLRRTLLCYSTLILFVILFVFFAFLQIFSKEFLLVENHSNKTLNLNLIKYRSSLIQCGKSFIRYEYLYRIIEQSKEFLRHFNRTKFIFNHDQLILSFESILSNCIHARLFSLIEQEKPTVIRRFISFLRKEFLYIVSFFY